MLGELGGEGSRTVCHCWEKRMKAVGALLAASCVMQGIGEHKKGSWGSSLDTQNDVEDKLGS